MSAGDGERETCPECGRDAVAVLRDYDVGAEVDSGEVCKSDEESPMARKYYVHAPDEEDSEDSDWHYEGEPMHDVRVITPGEGDKQIVTGKVDGKTVAFLALEYPPETTQDVEEVVLEDLDLSEHRL